MKSYLKLFALICAVTLSAAFVSACSDNSRLRPPPPPRPGSGQTEFLSRAENLCAGSFTARRNGVFPVVLKSISIFPSLPVKNPFNHDLTPADAPLLNVQVDGVWMQFPKGLNAVEVARRVGEIRPPLLLPPQAFHLRQLPHVPRRTRHAQARRRSASPSSPPTASPRSPGCPARKSAAPRSIAEGMGIRTDSPMVEEVPQGRDGISPHQPPARLPDLRPGRRMQAPGILGPVRQRRQPLHRRQGEETEARRHRRAHRPRRRTLHHVFALHPLLQGNGARRRARLHRPRQPHHPRRPSRQAPRQ